ncbi:MAG: hypothetical protein A2Y15_08745 [Clostridiales bacterium GWF2_36_10]|nr:MAG: hypothetical protein A2Y15_08745 [Clostridiales bacterium GWF2_36_10]HAN20431.1 hypothetical protein [Clostridiales bacterium]
MSTYTKTNWVDNTTPLSAGNLNKIEAGIEKAVSISKYPTAAGTGTAITVSALNFALENGESLTFIAAANNSSSATTLNVNDLGAKSIYKPGGTLAPKLISGKAYTVWYNAAGGNFFIKASAEGDAVAANVLAEKTFSNDSETGLVGTMTERGVIGITPSSYDQLIPEGHYLNSVVYGDSDLVSGNIKSGVEIFGVNGSFTADATATANLLLSGLIAYVNGVKITGTMPNKNTAFLIVIPSTVDQTIPEGYYGGTFDSVTIAGSANLLPENIRDGVTIFGVTGNFVG